ncbi:hypothetical protein Fmac_013539 [Flemingia macrophylla]|uniref:Uncharacterized protein n=1 Tax=Flemingia macrophylla TaxID=520843 RepID=A0ABD1MUD4_9FABA
MDLSALLLIEDSADSEEDYVLLTVCPNSIAITYANEDDAESCCCDTTSTCGLSEDDEGHEDDKEFAEFGSNEVAVLEDEAETRVGEVIANELEDRLFWESCMAVGYP